MESVKGMIKWRLRNNKSEIILSNGKEVIVNPLESKKCIKLNLEDMINENNIRDIYLEFLLIVEGKCKSAGTLLFVKPKHFKFIDPCIKASVTEEESCFIIALKSEAFAKSVELELKETDCRFSDNYFDLPAGYTKSVLVDKSGLSCKLKAEEVKKQLRIRSLYDIEER